MRCNSALVLFEESTICAAGNLQRRSRTAVFTDNVHQIVEKHSLLSLASSVLTTKSRTCFSKNASQILLRNLSSLAIRNLA